MISKGTYISQKFVFEHIKASIQVNFTTFLEFLVFCIVSPFAVKLTNVGHTPTKIIFLVFFLNYAQAFGNKIFIQ